MTRSRTLLIPDPPRKVRKLGKRIRQAIRDAELDARKWNEFQSCTVTCMMTTSRTAPQRGLLMYAHNEILMALCPAIIARRNKIESFLSTRQWAANGEGSSLLITVTDAPECKDKPHG